MPALLVLELHEPDAVDPGGDLGRVAYDPRPQLVPLAVLPERGPGRGLDRQRERGLDGDDLRDLAAKAEVPNRDTPREPLAVDSHQVAAGVVVDHRLIRLALLGAAEEQAAVGAEVVPHLQGDLEVAVGLVGDDDPAVPRPVLAADDRAVLDNPLPARAVPRLAADVP